MAEALELLANSRLMHRVAALADGHDPIDRTLFGQILDSFARIDHQYVYLKIAQTALSAAPVKWWMFWK